MSLRPQDLPAIPAQTARVARAALPKGKTIMRPRDACGRFSDDPMFHHLSGKRGAPGYAPWYRDAVTIFPYMDDLSDRQAADAVRSRLDWQYSLSLELTDAGFDQTILCMFRARLLHGEAAQKMFAGVLDAFKARGFLKAWGRQRTDSTPVLCAVRSRTRLGCVHATVRYTLNVLAAALPHWVKTHGPPEWFARYAHHLAEFRLPKSEIARHTLAAHIGGDGYLLLGAVYPTEPLAWLRALPAVETLRHVWVQHSMGTETAPSVPRSRLSSTAIRAVISPVRRTRHGSSLPERR